MERPSRGRLLDRRIYHAALQDADDGKLGIARSGFHEDLESAMAHASYSYPSHLVPLIDLALVLAAALLMAAAPRWSARLAAAAWRVPRRLGRRPGRALAILAVLGTVANGAVFLLQGAPVPAATDELSYLLAADTFAAGRLTNPYHPKWRHFHPHPLWWPVCASKYPPAQGLYLALGQVLTGSPAVAVCLGAPLLAAAVGWALFGWLRPKWAVLGGFLVLVRLGVGSYWNQSYWGGTVAAVGGALLFGALPRFLDRPRPGMGLVMAAGVVVLANSRPYEGLLVSLPTLAVLAVRGLREARTRRALLPGALVLALAGGAMAFYNKRVTGDPLLLPHRAYANAYNHEPELVFVPYSPPKHAYQKLPPRSSAASRPAGERPSWLARSLRQGIHRLGRMLYFVLGCALAFAPLFARYRGRPRHVLLAVSCALVAAGDMVTRAWFPHYSAPLTVPLLVLALLGLRLLAAWRRGGRRPWRAAPWAVAAIFLTLFAVELPAHRSDADAWNVVRQRLEEELRALPGKHLVIVDPPGDWPSSAADVDAAPVVWARPVDEASDRRLLEYYRDRSIWWLDLTRNGMPVLVPYSGVGGEVP